MRFTALFIILLSVIAVSCLSTDPSADTVPVFIGLDVSHRTNVAPAFIEEMGKRGLSIVYFDDEITPQRLSRCDTLLILQPRSEYSEQERKALAEWVESGKRLICAGQAWSWTMPAYDNKPLDRFPLNGLGSDLGFLITDESIGEPKSIERTLLQTGETLQKGWSPSRIVFKTADYSALIRDGSGKLMAGSLTLGSGTVFVFGNELILQQNPGLVEYCIRN